MIPPSIPGQSLETRKLLKSWAVLSVPCRQPIRLTMPASATFQTLAVPVIGLFLLLVSSGCRPQEVARNTASSPSSNSNMAAATVRPVRIVVVAAPGLADSIQQNWKARSNQPITVRNIELEAWDAMLQNESPQGTAADAVVFPPRDLGQLASKSWLLPAPEYVLQDDSFAEGDLAKSDIFMSLRRGSMNWGEAVLALPMTSAQPLLIFDRGRFSQANTNNLPSSWGELSQLLGSPSPPTFAQPLGQGWAARLLLIRVAAYVKEPGRYADVIEIGSLRPLIAEAPFVRALTELVADQQRGQAESLNWSPLEITEAVRAGEVQLGLAAFLGSTAPLPQESNWGVALLPGAKDVYQFADRTWSQRDSNMSIATIGLDGRVAGVLSGTRRQKITWSVLVQLTGKRYGTDYCAQGPYASPFRISQLNSPQGWLHEALEDGVVKEYGQAVRAALSSPAVLIVPRLPGAARYLESLDRAVLSAVRGEVSPESALQAAAVEWEGITEQLGRSKQAEHLLRHYGLMK